MEQLNSSCVMFGGATQRTEIEQMSTLKKSTGPFKICALKQGIILAEVTGNILSETFSAGTGNFYTRYRKLSR